MSLDPLSQGRASSPANSGRQSPTIRWHRRPLEEGPPKKDKAFRRYESNVDRALALFDTQQQEWADYVSLLGRLLKAIQTHPHDVTFVPHSATVATRLAQCLNPSLPSGVHQKAIEVYAYIFSVLQTRALSQSLHIFFPGLAPVLSFASLSVRPAFLSLIETYVLAIGAQALRPALKSIILCLLPGLEDETAEDFARVLHTIDKLRFAISGDQGRTNDSVGSEQDSYFWQCFFLATITNAPRRQGGLAYLVRKLPKFVTEPRRTSNAAVTDSDMSVMGGLSMAAEAAIAPEPGLLIRCFAAGLGDAQLLTQRGYLDLLVTSLPLHSEVLQARIDGSDLERLVSAAAGVVIRRDMSLNRRLWSWLLGPDPVVDTDGSDELADSRSPTVDLNSHHAVYFARYGLQALTNGIMSMVKSRDQSPAARAKPFRICLSLMDRWEVGGLLVPSVFLPLLESARCYSETTTRQNTEDIIRSASIFFDGVESALIWGKLFELLDDAMSPNTVRDAEALHKLRLAKFIITRFNIREQEMLLHHIPLVSCAILQMLNHSPLPADDQDDLQATAFATKLEIAEILIENMPDRELSATSKDDDGINMPSPTIELVRAFYAEEHGNIEAIRNHYCRIKISNTLLEESVTLFVNSLHVGISDAAKEASTKLLSNLLLKISDTTIVSGRVLLAAFEDSLTECASQNAESCVPFSSIIAIISIMTALQSDSASANLFPSEHKADLVQSLVASIWYYLSPFRPKYHVESVRCLWQLQAMTASDHLVETAVATQIARATSTTACSGPASGVDAGRHLEVLWTFTIHEQNQQTQKPSRLSRRASGSPAFASLNILEGGYQSVLTRPLFLLIDALMDEDTELFLFVRTWLQDLPSLNRVFDIILSHLQGLNCLKYQSTSYLEVSVPRPPVAVDDSRECLYHMQQLLHILRWSSNHTWVVLSKSYVTVLDSHANGEHEVTIQSLVVRTCMRALSVSKAANQSGAEPHIDALHRTAISIIRLVLLNPYALPLRDLELDVFLMARLPGGSPSLQSLLLDATLAALQLRLRSARRAPSMEERASREHTGRTRESTEKDVEENACAATPPPELVDCLRHGFSSHTSRLVLDDWVRFLTHVLPLFADTIFQNLLPLVECLCKQIQSAFEQLKSTFSEPGHAITISSESTIISLMNGLEEVLENAHQRLFMRQMKATTARMPDQPQGFFGNVVSGVFANEPNHIRSSTANSRLTVLLCFQDTVRICFAVWSWGGYDSVKHDHASLSSFAYTSLRVRNRARRILEHLFTAEALECLETLAVVWCRSSRESHGANAVMSLLNVLNGSSPKHTTPAIFNSIYSRTNPSALDPHRMSTLTSSLSDIDLVAFLVEYTKSLEDDAMDEIWPDCLTFLRDVLANPMPHRQALPGLIEFTAILAEKVENTNFGEKRRMRRDLGDLFMRLLTATFTTRPMGYFQDTSSLSVDNMPEDGEASVARSSDVVSVLVSILPKLPLILTENDRIANAATSISTNVIGPAFRTKAFPETVSPLLLDLIYELTRTSSLPAATKTWKRDIETAFNDTRFFATGATLAKEKWLPILRIWSQNDKERMPELLSRLSSPASAGIMFGVGASSARLEADRKTQLTLRRMAMLLLANPEDTYALDVGAILERLAELITATPASSPSSATRADIFVFLRALVLRISPTHLAPVWPIVTSELTSALASALPHDKELHERYSNLSLLQACKLLDTLVAIAHDDFQLHEWLFLTDTIDAVYRPGLDWQPVALVDEIADALQERFALASASSNDGDGDAVTNDAHTSDTAANTLRSDLSIPGSPARRPSGAGVRADDNGATRRSLLLPVLRAAQEAGVCGDSADAKAMGKMEFVTRVVHPFLGQLSILAFEETYRMGKVDVGEMEAWVIDDVFDEGGIA